MKTVCVVCDSCFGTGLLQSSDDLSDVALVCRKCEGWRCVEVSESEFGEKELELELFSPDVYEREMIDYIETVVLLSGERVRYVLFLMCYSLDNFLLQR